MFTLGQVRLEARSPRRDYTRQARSPRRDYTQTKKTTVPTIIFIYFENNGGGLKVLNGHFVGKHTDINSRRAILFVSCKI